MKKYTLCLLIIFVSLTLRAQVYDDFSDGDFSNNPAWLGDTDVFTINSSLQLQLNASDAGTSCLSTEAKLLEGKMEWSFWIRLNFAGSNSNFARFYLIADQQDLTRADLNGYYLRFGEAGTTDAVRFYKQTGAVHELLCSGTEGAIANAFSLYIKMMRSDSGHWQLYTLTDEMLDYLLEAECVDTTHTDMKYIGMYCTYTKSNSTRFYFDNIYCDLEYVDTEPPFVESCVATDSSRSIVIHFNEAVDSVAALNIQNYSLNSNIGNPDTIIALSENYRMLELQFSNLFPHNTSLTLQISNISDLAGNVMKDTSFSFRFYKSKLFDIVINEIMPKPSPEVGLPEAEYVELKNRTSYEINLNNWQMLFGKTIRTFGNVSIAPNDYLIVVKRSNSALLEPYGKVAVFSDMAIIDGGVLIQLLDNHGEMVHFVDFSSTWHEEDKKAGGWSLEMIDFENPCQEIENWASSKDVSGGTPGKQNSVYSPNPDMISPKLSNVSSLDSMNILVSFSEKMLPEKLSNKNAYKINKNIVIDSVKEISTNMTSVSLALKKPLQSGVLYTLNIQDTLHDCMCNILPLKSSFVFGYAEKIDSLDVVINEVLFNPGSQGVDFVEIYNRSKKVIDLKNLRLSTPNREGEIDTGKFICATYQLFPDEYALLTTKPKVVQTQYHYLSEDNFVEMQSFPSYPNESGDVILLSDERQVIDRFQYTSNMHYSLLKSVVGVSLERINPERKTQDASNWHSAASTVGHATPGYRNSCFSENMEPTSAFEIYPQIFSPDQDGYDDILNIAYTFDQPGYRLTITIYNSNGNKVRVLENNVLVETNGVFTWDGTTDNGLKAGMGIYIIHFEYWNLEGKVHREKKAVTLAIKL